MEKYVAIQNFKRHSEWQTGQLSLSNWFFRLKASDLSCHTEFFVFSPFDLSNLEVIRCFPTIAKGRFNFSAAWIDLEKQIEIVCLEKQSIGQEGEGKRNLPELS